MSASTLKHPGKRDLSSAWFTARMAGALAVTANQGSSASVCILRCSCSGDSRNDGENAGSSDRVAEANWQGGSDAYDLCSVDTDSAGVRFVRYLATIKQEHCRIHFQTTAEPERGAPCRQNGEGGGSANAGFPDIQRRAQALTISAGRPPISERCAAAGSRATDSLQAWA